MRFVQRTDWQFVVSRFHAIETVRRSRMLAAWRPTVTYRALPRSTMSRLLFNRPIVAREIAIPAVVGCGIATVRLHTGDRVRVNGAQGTVEVLHAADRPIE